MMWYLTMEESPEWMDIFVFPKRVKRVALPTETALFQFTKGQIAPFSGKYHLPSRIPLADSMENCIPLLLLVEGYLCVELTRSTICPGVA